MCYAESWGLDCDRAGMDAVGIRRVDHLVVTRYGWRISLEPDLDRASSDT